MKSRLAFNDIDKMLDDEDNGFLALMEELGIICQRLPDEGGFLLSGSEFSLPSEFAISHGHCQDLETVE